MVCSCVHRDSHCDPAYLLIDPDPVADSHPDLDIASDVANCMLVGCRGMIVERHRVDAGRDLHQDCVIGGAAFPRRVHLCRIDPHLCDFAWTKSMCCLQVMVSAYPRGEPLLQAN
jgi:hypothetical protein